MNRVYRRKNFEIYGYNGAYVVYNKNKPFEAGHTHINNFKTAKYIIHLAVTMTVPKHLSLYLYESLIRISTDKEYKEILYKKIDKDKSKKSQY